MHIIEKYRSVFGMIESYQMEISLSVVEARGALDYTELLDSFLQCHRATLTDGLVITAVLSRSDKHAELKLSWGESTRVQLFNANDILPDADSFIAEAILKMISELFTISCGQPFPNARGPEHEGIRELLTMLQKGAPREQVLPQDLANLIDKCRVQPANEFIDITIVQLTLQSGVTIVGMCKEGNPPVEFHAFHDALTKLRDLETYRLACCRTEGIPYITLPSSALSSDDRTKLLDGMHWFI